jgi:hypothetical protein
VRQLNAYLRQRLRELPLLTPVTPEDPELSSAMVACTVDGMTVGNLYKALADRGINIKQTGYNSVVTDSLIAKENTKVIRLSTHISNDEAQIDRLVEEMAAILGVSTRVDTDGLRPRAFGTDPNYPNPFNSSTQIGYELPRASQVEVAIYNAGGQAEEVIAAGWQEAGAHRLTWDAGNRASGTYYYEIRAGAERLARKMVLLK